MTAIAPYSAWGSRGQGGAAIGPVGLVIVHHWYRPHIGFEASRGREAEALRGVESFHTDGNGWGPGTGYQFHAFSSGRAWEGRGWGRSGAHTVGHNGDSVAIALPIDGDRYAMTADQAGAVMAIIREGLRGGHIVPGYRVRGHRDFSPKSCPGSLVSDSWLRSLEGLDPTPELDDLMEDEMIIKFSEDGKVKVMFDGSGRVRHLSPSANDAVRKLERDTDRVINVGEAPGLSQAGFED